MKPFLDCVNTYVTDKSGRGIVRVPKVLADRAKAHDLSPTLPTRRVILPFLQGRDHLRYCATQPTDILDMSSCSILSVQRCVSSIIEV